MKRIKNRNLDDEQPNQGWGGKGQVRPGGFSKRWEGREARQAENTQGVGKTNASESIWHAWGTGKPAIRRRSDTAARLGVGGGAAKKKKRKLNPKIG